MRTLRALLFSSYATIAVACSSPSSPPGAAPPPPADDAGSPDDAAPAAFTPAPHPDAPVIPNAGGTILAAPKLAVATFGDEPFAAQLETFAKGIGATPYWAATTREYGVGPAQFARSVRVAAPPPSTVSQADVEAWLVSQLDGTHDEWGTPDASTLYTIVYPKGTQVTIDGQSVCSSAPAFHFEVQLASGMHVPYVVLTRCDPMFGLSGIDFVTAGLSHEWIEASTDPFVASKPAYAQAADVDTSWTLLTGGELADMCTLTDTVYFTPSDFPFKVQRSWSNASAAAGHDPCAPPPEGAYFNAAPVLPDTVHGSYGGQPLSTRGVRIPVGQSRTIDVDLFSDAETNASWDVSAHATGKLLSFAWSAKSGTNGDRLELTITRVRDDPSTPGFAAFTVVSKLGAEEHAWVGAVGD